MNMRSRKAFLVAVSFLLMAGTIAEAAKGKAAAALVKQINARILKEAGQEVGERTAKKMAVTIATRFGQQGDDVLRVMGRSGLEALNKAGRKAGPRYAHNLLQYGDDALRLAKTPAGRNLLNSGSDIAIRAAIRQGPNALPLISSYGDDAAKALVKIQPQSAQTLSRLQANGCASKAEFRELLDVVARHGDQSVRYIEQHWKFFLGAGAVAMFVANPDRYLDGAKEITEKIIDKPFDTVRDVWNQTVTRIVESPHFRIVPAGLIGALLFVIAGRLWLVYIREKRAWNEKRELFTQCDRNDQEIDASNKAVMQETRRQEATR